MPSHPPAPFRSLAHGVLLALGCAAGAAHAATPPPYLDTQRSFEARAADLVSRMTLEEKAAQMQNAAPAIPRLGVPAYDWWNEALHGVARAGGATVFPQAINMAATFDLPLMHEVATAISDEARAKHHQFLRQNQHARYQGLTFWSPNINIFRDPRWGRGQETYGEDPFLTARMGVTFVQGLQGEGADAPKNAQGEPYRKLDATAKHFAVHSGPEADRHHFDAHPSQRDLYETYLPAFEALVKDGKVDAVMGAYNRVYGESASASKFLLQDVLRQQWGFKGYVVSDCWAIVDIWKHHKIVTTREQAAALAVKHGTELECGEEYSTMRRGVFHAAGGGPPGPDRRSADRHRVDDLDDRAHAPGQVRSARAVAVVDNSRLGQPVAGVRCAGAAHRARIAGAAEERWPVAVVAGQAQAHRGDRPHRR